MSNHVHFNVAGITGRYASKVQAGFMKFTARQIKFNLPKNHPLLLEKFKVNAADRISILRKKPVGNRIIHQQCIYAKAGLHPLESRKAGLCSLQEEYYFSSAKF